MKKILKSKLAPYIKGLLEELKVTGGTLCSTSVSTLYLFDNFIITNNFDNGELSQSLVEAWSIQRNTENKNVRNARISVIRRLANYMNSLGKDTYYPPMLGSCEYSKPYIPTRKELKLFFKTIDEDEPYYPYLKHMKYTYSVLFRLYYCLGLRRSEGVMLTREDVNLGKGTIYIRHSKGDKDRILYIRDDIKEMLSEFDAYIQNEIIPDRKWFFIRADKTDHLLKNSVSKKFHYFWLKAFPKWAGKRPTTHSLRHAFVVHRINDWVEEGNKAEGLLPYLSKFLGHSSISETMYYYHSFDTETKAYSRFIENDSLLFKEVSEWLN